MEAFKSLIDSYGSMMNFMSSILLACITLWYAISTKKILKATIDSTNLSQCPVIAFEINNISIGKCYGPKRRNMGIEVKIVNIGDSPAINIIIDSEIELNHTSISTENIIPSRFEPDVITFLMEKASKEESFSYGNTFLIHFFDNSRECHRLNMHRIETDPSKEAFKEGTLHVYAYYSNAFGQTYKSCASFSISLCGIAEHKIPNDNETAKCHLLYIPKPIFTALPIKMEILSQEIGRRNKKRELCGW